jgi:hypothetical protein
MIIYKGVSYNSTKLICTSKLSLMLSYPNYNKLEIGKIYDGFLVYVYGNGTSGCVDKPNGDNTQPCGWYIDGVSSSINENFGLEFFKPLRDYNLSLINL